MSVEASLEKPTQTGARDRWPGWMRSLFALHPAKKAYVLGGTLLLVSLAGVALPVDDAPFRSIGWVGGLVLTFALACEAYLLIARVADAAWAKWLMVPVLIMGGALAIGDSARLVNVATGQDPELFPRATTFMAPIAALPILGFVAIVLLAFSVVAFMFTWTAQLGSKDRARERRAWFWFARFIASFAAISFVSPAVETKSGFHTGVSEWAPRLVAGLDMHIDPQCGPAPSDRVKRLNDDLVVLAQKTPAGLVFRRVECALAPQ
ncbi:hypothetical protein [Luteimonas terricola]|uniref:hypothetical protein n=1 Tax=Luteimonas terricola TaxID=645597 RepID=UPI001044A45F|nr:hypothetical protein [Luteimonas terricola]